MKRLLNRLWKSCNKRKSYLVPLSYNSKLRELMKYRTTISVTPKVIDISDTEYEGVIREDNLSFTDMDKYRIRVLEALSQLAESQLVIQKIRRAKPLTEFELNGLQSLLLERDSNFTIADLHKKFDESIDLEKFIRLIVGLEPEYVKHEFDRFRKNHTKMNANQIQFLNLLEQEIAKAGGIFIERLYDYPFTRFHSNSIDGVFNESESNEIFEILDEFKIG